MKSNILYTSCNSHCRHHHHVCSIEVFLSELKIRMMTMMMLMMMMTMLADESCRHHHHVRPIEIFLNSANHTHDYDRISHHRHVCWSLSSYQWRCLYDDVYDVYAIVATGKRSSLLKGESLVESRCLYTYESLIWPPVTLKSVTVYTS